jgi:aryl-alcohol dehydrogenase-like predicted oxidoreductase
MEFRQLKHTDLRVSRLCFGTMTFAGQTDQPTAAAMVDRCIDAGINFFDTANAYEHGKSEIMLGEVLKGKRDKLILASKVFNTMGDAPDESGLSKAAIFKAIDDSLRRLQTDYLDIYYLHQPDYSVPMEETLDAMNTLVRQGKVRYIATSNYAGWQICQMHCIAQQKKFQVPGISQSMYNLLARGIEQEFVPMAKEVGVSIIAYNPLAGGLLTGKHSGPQTVTPGTRFDKNKMYQERYWHAQDFEAVEKLKKIAADAGRSLISLALNWLLHHTVTDCVVLGASRVEQLTQNLQLCTEGALPADVLAACDQVWKDLRGPTPQYNR